MPLVSGHAILRLKLAVLESSMKRTVEFTVTTPSGMSGGSAFAMDRNL
jgi:hypothetical protein